MDRSIKVITPKCPFCGKTNELMLDADGINAYKHGELVGTAFPYLTLDERELLISGTCSSCWDNMKCE